MRGTPLHDAPASPGATAVLERTFDSSLGARYRAIRAHTEALCAPLEIEDYVVRSMPDVSPTKWHLAHTSWFFETFVLAPNVAEYIPCDPRYAFLFNSYYVQAGERHCRAQRGLATRPTVAQVYAYRAHVDAAMARVLERIDADDPAFEASNDVVHLRSVIELGLQHEQQHQELILTDIKHVFWMNPLRPAYYAAEENGTVPRARRSAAAPGASAWLDITEGVYQIGHDTKYHPAERPASDGNDFAFDNEGPRHNVYLHDARVASKLVTMSEYLAFMNDGGYQRPELWLSAGWDAVRNERWEAPLYWERETPDAPWHEFTLHGMREVADTVLDEPVCHVSFFEADAYARWAGARLPTEAEWEVFASMDGGSQHATNLFGTVWQWTASPYVGYPGYMPASGAIGEYNGKWMSDQWVLRGSSCATPPHHSRLTYRNFFPAATRWQFAGIRLARDP